MDYVFLRGRETRPSGPKRYTKLALGQDVRTTDRFLRGVKVYVKNRDDDPIIITRTIEDI